MGDTGFERVTCGISRTVFLVGPYAIKVPCGRYGWEKVLRGMLANWHERRTWRWANAEYRWWLCPVLFADPFGLVVVMPRASVEKLATGVLDRHLVAFEREWGYPMPVEHKWDSFGLLRGRLVAVDYGEGA